MTVSLHTHEAEQRSEDFTDTPENEAGMVDWQARQAVRRLCELHGKTGAAFRLSSFLEDERESH